MLDTTESLILCKNGHTSIRNKANKCKQCIAEASKRYRIAHPERTQSIQKNWYENNKNKHKDYNKIQYERRKQSEGFSAYCKALKLKSNYGLSLDDFNFLILEQENRCAICSELFSDIPHVDHNHETNEIRGLLCRTCNIGLGHFKDNHKLLESAMSYLLGDTNDTD